MTPTHTATLCIDCAEGFFEDERAEYEIIGSKALLVGFRIGARQFKRSDAVEMTGADHVERQEALVYRDWCEADAHDEQNPPEGYRLRGYAA